MLRISCLLVCVSGVLTAATGCVPQNRYDAVVAQRDAAEGERQRLESELGRVNAALTRAESGVRNREQTIAIGRNQLSELELSRSRTATERDDALAIVEQLRGELGRIGEHLRESSEQRKDLEHALAEADARAERLAEAALGPAVTAPTTQVAARAERPAEVAALGPAVTAPTTQVAARQPNDSRPATDLPPSTRSSSPVTNVADAR